MAAEFQRAQEIIELLNTEQDTKEVFEDLIEARETYGIAYLEVIRNLAGEVVQIDFIKDTPSIRKTKPLAPYIPSIYYHHGKQLKRRKRYCKYRQEIGGKTVYFREFGDPRIMDSRDGKYLAKGETLDLEYQANEIMEFAVGTEPYGEVRWIGQVLGVDGSRKAESLNNNYFEINEDTDEFYNEYVEGCYSAGNIEIGNYIYSFSVNNFDEQHGFIISVHKYK